MGSVIAARQLPARALKRIVRLWQRRTLAHKFMAASLVVLVTSMVAVGWWIGREIEAGVVHRTAETTALYVDSFVAPNLDTPIDAGELPPDRIGALSRLLAETPLGRNIVAFKLWDLHGRVLYSNETEMIGEVYPMTEKLAAAAQGQIVSEISLLDDEENETERGRWPRLLETYSPIRVTPDGEIVAVAEFYQTTDSLDDDLAEAQRRTWLAVIIATLVIYLTLSGLVKRGSDTIEQQQHALVQTVDELTVLLAQNRELHARVRRAASRVTTLSERSLRRIGADLHDGPAQEISLALLRLSASGASPAAVSRADVNGTPEPRAAPTALDVAPVEASLGRALQEIRNIAAGLRLPELERLTLAETVLRVIQVHERRTESTVTVRLDALPETASLPTKITIYRVIQEALANAYRHAGGIGLAVTVSAGPTELHVQVSDAGPGLSQRQTAGEHLGLAVMRERVESIGGSFRLDTRPGDGTTIAVTLPRDSEEEESL